MSRLVVLLVLVFATLLVSAFKHGDQDLVVKTSMGIAQGVPARFPFASSAVQWLGLPFGQPPVGLLRFQPPQPFSSPWNGTRVFSEYAADCYATNGGMSYSPNGMSEDCLYLNVYAPPANRKNLPVVMFFYGGGWNMGSASFPVYNGASIIGDGKQNIIVITVSYRLAHFGFLASNQLRSLRADNGTGNMGLLDQRLAMQWARNNIEAFGGNPNSITIWGESAGAGSVSNHLVMPGSKGFFDAAIMDSGPLATWIADLMDEQQVQFDLIANHVGCNPANGSDADVVRCLQKVDPKVLIKSPSRPPHELGARFTEFAPTVDGVELPQAPWLMAQQGLMHPVPVLTGTNVNEGTLLVGGGGASLPINQSLTPAEYQVFMQTFFGSIADDVLQMYPASDYKSPWWAVTQLISDMAMLCPARRTARWANAPAYLYYFAHEIDVAKLDPNLGVFHGDELVFAWVLRWFYATWDKDVPPAPIPLFPAERTLQDETCGYFMSFAASHDPNSENKWPTWPVANSKDQPLMDLDTGTLKPLPEVRGKYCDFWDTYQNWR